MGSGSAISANRCSSRKHELDSIEKTLSDPRNLKPGPLGGALTAHLFGLSSEQWLAGLSSNLFLRSSLLLNDVETAAAVSG